MHERHVIEYDLTDEMAQRLGRTLVDRHFYTQPMQRYAPWIILALAAGLIVLHLAGILPQNALAYLLAVLGVLTGYAWLRRQLLHRDLVWAFLLPFHGQTGRRVRLVLTPTLLDLNAGGETQEAEWEEVAAVWVLEDFWILRLKTGGQIVVPIEALPPQGAALIRRRADEVQARILEDA